MSLVNRPRDIGFPVRTNNKNVPIAKNIGPANKENIASYNINKENMPARNVQTNKFENVPLKPSSFNNANKENPPSKNVMFSATKENPTTKNVMFSATKENVSVKSTPIGSSTKKGHMSKGCGSGFDDSYWSENKENIHPNFFDPVQSPYVTRENVLANTSNSSTKSKPNPFRELNLSNRKSTPTARKEGIRKLDEKPREPNFMVPEKRELPKPQLEKPNIFDADSGEDSDLSFSF